MIYQIKFPAKMPVSNRRSGCLGLAVALTMVLTACGGGSATSPDVTAGDGADSAGEGGARVAPGGKDNKGGSANGGASGAVDCDLLATETSVLNESIYHSGFEVALGSAVLTPATESCTPGDVAVDATFRNRGSDPYQFDAEVILTSGGHDYALSFATDIPRVPAARTGKGVLHFAVDRDFSLSDATLTFGGARLHQALVPLGAESPDAFTSLMAYTVPLMGKFTAGTLQFDMKGGYIRPDQPWDHTTLDKKHYNVLLLFSATYVASNGAGGNNTDKDNFSLKLPDGTSVAADDGPIELFSNVGTTLDDLYVSFTVPGPMEGKFALEAIGRWGQKYAAASIVMPFEVPHIAEFGE